MQRAPIIAALAAAALLPMAAPAFADRALLIGIDRYSDAKLALPQPGSSAKDVAAVAGLLRTKLGYGQNDIQILSDQAASRGAVMSAIDNWLVKGTKPGERAFLYYSGLGYFQPGARQANNKVPSTLIPFDAVVGAGNPPAIANMISEDEFLAELKKLTGRKVTVLLDTGFSGVVSAGGASVSADLTAIRAPLFGGQTRAIQIEPVAQAQKAEGESIDTVGLGPDIAIFTATAGGQAPLVGADGGVFTKAFVDAVGTGAADVNKNGNLSNEEILAFLRDQSNAACSAAANACQLGLTPTLGPVAAVGGTPLAVKPGPTQLTADRVLDYFAKGNTVGVKLEQYPPSPVPLGTRDMKFRIVSPVAGHLVLLDLTDTGKLTQLFPNQYTRDRVRDGYILANSPIVIPDAYYGIRFDASTPERGTLIALVTNGPVELPMAVKTRKIEVIPVEEAANTYLPAIVGALDAPVDTQAKTATHALDWSVATLRYEILGR